MLSVTSHSEPFIHDLNNQSIKLIFDYLETSRNEISCKLDSSKRAALGQFLTPVSVAWLMASMFDETSLNQASIVDPGSGISTLFAALTIKLCSMSNKPEKISVTAYEIDPLFFGYLDKTIDLCENYCLSQGITLHVKTSREDFVASAVSLLGLEFATAKPVGFTHAILNPPYHKIQTSSQTRKLIRKCGIETSNIYTAFMALTSQLLTNGGQMVSITPRSFCNGVYFKPFRKMFLRSMEIEKIHSFHSRREAFKDDDVLQENIILKAHKDAIHQPKICLSFSKGAEDKITELEVDRDKIILPNDKDSIIHVVTEELENRTSKVNGQLNHTLQSLGLQVSTGPVVDFRLRKYIVPSSDARAVPLIYPFHFVGGYVTWPAPKPKKPDAILPAAEIGNWLLPSECYVVVKRFSSKEQEKRIIAAIYDPSRFRYPKVGLENHLNYFHSMGKGLDITLAKGLAAYLNSTLTDSMFRLFSGHTQVNADDLRRLKYPQKDELKAIGEHIEAEFPNQVDLDRIVEFAISQLTKDNLEASLI